MKTIKVLIAAALLSGVSTLAIAGPGPQFWAQQSKNQQEQKAKADAPAKEPMACNSCCCCTSMKK